MTVHTFPSSQDIGNSQTPKPDASMWIYLWDLVDEGYDDVCSFLRERSITSLSLACAYHAGKFLAPHNPVRKVIIPEDGTLYFTPDASLFKAITPVVNSLVARGHSFASVQRHAEGFGLEMRAWVVCCHNSRIGAAHPSAACVTAFGDILPHNLCPANRDVRDYLRAVIGSLARQGARTIELEALQFQGYAHGFHHEREGIVLTPLITRLLGLCFCPSCIESARGAGVEIDAVRAWTRATLELYFLEPSAFEHGEAAEALPPEALFAPFEAWREDVITGLAAELADSVAGFPVQLRPMASIVTAAQRLAGVVPGRIAAATGGMVLLGYMKDDAALRPHLVEAQHQLGTYALTLGMHAGMPESGGKKEFRARMTLARSLGVTRFNFYHYGFVPRAHIDWIAEALA